PSAAGTYTFYLNATDAVGSVSDARVTVTVEPALVATLSAAPSPTQVGGSSTLTITLTNGVPPYAWTLYNGKTEVDSGTSASATYTFAPSAAGTYTFYLNATDAVGSVSDAQVTVTVEPALVATLSAAPSMTQVGDSSTLTITLANGVPPYAWTLYNGKTEVDSGTSASVTYTFTPSTAGTYTFYLNATDAVGSVSDARVTVTVEPALLATLSATPSTTQVGGSSTLTITLTNGVPPYAWTLYNGKTEVDSGTSASATYTFSPSAVGTYTFYLNATDAVGSVSDARVTVTVEPALVATLSAAPSTTQVGGSSTLTITLTNGVPPYAWTLYNGNVEVDSGTSASATYTFTPSAAGTYTFYLNATDAVGSVSNARVTVTVEPALVATLSAAPSTTQVGGSSTLTITLTNGVPPYAWTLYNGKTEVDSGTSASATYTFTPSVAGAYTFYLNATDAVGSVSDARVTVTVEPALVATLSAAPSTTQVGGSSTLTITLANGVPPYAWTLYDGNVEVDSGTSASATYTFTPSAAGTYTFYLNATDAVGSLSEATVKVTVEPALAATLSASASRIDVGQTSVLTFGFSGGVAPVTWTLTVSGSSANLSGVTGEEYTFSPGAPGTYTFYLNATDAVGSVSRASVRVVVDPTLSAGAASATPNPLDAGQSTTVSTTGATGGLGPYTYTWSGLPPGCADPGSVTVFSCTPSIAGTYPVTLTVTDANGNTATTVVTLDVGSGLSAGAATATPNPVDVAQSTTVSTTGATGGAAPYTYAWSGLPAGCGDPGNVSAFGCTPTSPGTYTVTLVVTDGNGNRAATTLTLKVDPALSLGTASASPNPVDVGQSTTISTSGATGGAGPYTYAWSGLPSGCSNPGSVTSFTCTPSADAPYLVTLRVTDANGNTATASVSLIVDPMLSTGTPTATPNPVDAGQPTTISTTGASGGAGPYAYAWSGLPIGCVNVSGPSVGCTSTQVGTFPVTLTVTDANGNAATATFDLVVDPALGAGALSATPNPVDAGDATSIATTGATGGAAPYLYAWSGLPPGCTNPGSVPSFSCTPASVGTYLVSLLVTDGNGNTASAAFSLTVVTGVAPTYGVTFTETGLPSGTEWFVNISGGGSHSSITATIAFSEPNGTYDYTIGTANTSYKAAPGAFGVSGAAVGKSVAFTLVTYSLTFTETGVPTGLTWYLNLSDGQRFSSTTTTISFTEPNGSYGYMFGATPQFPKWFSALPGTAVVHGAAVAVAVAFTEVRQVILTEKGLPTGMEWWANFTGGYSFSSTATTMLFYMPAGTWTYTLMAADHDYAAKGRTFIVHSPLALPHKALKFSVTFRLVRFTTTVTETGLPHGAKWCVVVSGGGTSCSTGTRVHFLEPNGSYTYTLTTTRAGYSGAGGSFTVHGATSVAVSFTHSGGVPAVTTSVGTPGSVPVRSLTGWGASSVGLGLLGVALLLARRKAHTSSRGA
ncbi:MAG TPA: hypothetical protein VEH10_01095, partial [Thermoplasmata archaeon]|nr:hypothetical protein [Thermoplasmata archaeon]